MVCWASPNQDSDRQSERRAEAMENIDQFKSNKKLMESLQGFEKSLKTSSGVLPCVEGSVYKVPFIEVGGADSPHAAKKRKTSGGAASTSSGATSSAKGKSLAHSASAGSATLVTLREYPPSDTALTKLKKAAVATGEPSAKASTSKKQETNGYFIDAERISFLNEEEWLDKGLKTPTGKIVKTLVPDSIDPKSVKLNLVRLQLVGDEGLDWQSEAQTDNLIGILMVVLPLKFKGGKISVRKGDESWSIDPAKSKSTVRCGWIAFSSEAEVQIEPVTQETTQALLVYHIVGKEKKGKNNGQDAEKAVFDGLDKISKQLPADTPINRFGIFLTNKYNPKSYSASILKGQDRWLYNLLKDSKYEVKLTFVRVLMTAWGFFDSRDWDQPEKKVQLTECGEEFMESEIWEMDMSKAEKWTPKKWKDDDHKEHESLYCAPGEHHKCRRLPWEMPWLHKSLFSAIPQMTRVDREPLPSWSEGLWLSETYRVGAFIVTVKPGFTDEKDGPFTHFYPVAHPDPRGVSEREDMDWSRPVLHWRLPGDTQEELDDIESKFWARRNWVHQELD